MANSLTNTEEHPRHREVRGYGQFFFFVSTAHISDDISFICRNNVKNLIVNGRSDYTDANLDFLEQVGSQVEWLVVTPPKSKSFNFEGLGGCSNLRKLKINNDSEDEVDLTSCGSLQLLDVARFSAVKGFEKLAKLERAVLDNVPSGSLQAELFSSKENLTFVAFANTDFGNGLRFLFQSSIRELRFYFCKNVDFSGVSDIALESIWIEACKRASNTDEIYRTRSLRELAIIDSFVIDSATTLDNLGSLESLILLGTSHFENGDLGPLKNRLRYFGFDDREHYSVTKEQFSSEFLRGKEN